MSFLNLCYITSAKPYETSQSNKIEVFGEMVIYLCLWSTMLYIMYFQSNDALSMVGFFQMALIGIMIFVNLGFALTDVDIRAACKWWSKKNKDEQNQR